MLKPKDLCPRAGTRTFLEAMQAGKVHLARFVLDALDRSIIDCRAEQGRTPLMVAVGLPDPALRARFVRLLLEQGAAVNLRDERGRTALSLACERGHLDAVQLLVQFSGDPEAADAAGNSPVMWAAACGHGAVLEFLVRSFRRLGLRLDRTNRAGHTALQLAAARGHGTCVQALTGPWGRAAAAAAARGSSSDSPPGRPAPVPSPERRRPSPRRLPRPLLARFARAAGGHSGHGGHGGHGGHSGEASLGGKGSARHRAQGSERPELGRSMSLALGAVTEEEAARLRAGALMALPHSPQSSGTGRWRSHEVLEGAPASLVQAPVGLSPHPEGGPGSGRLGLRRRSTAPDIPSLVGEAPGSESGPEAETNALPLSVPGPQPWQAGTEAVVLHAQQ
ncbi:ankyrin repeat domain-containing protein 63 isoform X1 [Tamandua tetradactyla]|uniref:ankyrin repeat domain-containing protein 63 isoform X1 n=1 Tax=Tamandua tetradactyla TaxID=48850 RepID=UPI00405453C2